MMLVYVESDQTYLQSRGSRTLYWLDDLGAIPLQETTPETEGFLFSYAREIGQYAELVAARPLLRDRPEEREPLTRLDATLDVLLSHNVQMPAPKTWRVGLDEPLPRDLEFPLFLRTAETSWKLSGNASRVNNEQEFAEEAAQLRRAWGWDAPILAREWMDFEVAGTHVYGKVPQEVRVWCVDSTPIAWSFHHMHIVSEPNGFPISARDACELTELASRVSFVFQSRFIVCDFAKRTDGSWVFLETGPGSAAGTGHEHVFKAVASALLSRDYPLVNERCGGRLS